MHILSALKVTLANIRQTMLHSSFTSSALKDHPKITVSLSAVVCCWAEPDAV